MNASRADTGEDAMTTPIAPETLHGWNLWNEDFTRILFAGRPTLTIRQIALDARIPVPEAKYVLLKFLESLGLLESVGIPLRRYWVVRYPGERPAREPEPAKGKIAELSPVTEIKTRDDLLRLLVPYDEVLRWFRQFGTPQAVDTFARAMRGELEALRLVARDLDGIP